MWRPLLIASLCLVASSATALVDQRTLSDTTDKQALTISATLGSAEAQYQLGLSYVTGQSNVEAAKWLRKAAEQGHVNAQNLLAMMYVAGSGVPHNNTEAARWHQEAAEQGNADSQATLAVMYYVGLGVPKSKVSAYQWATIALTNPTQTFEYQSALQEALTELTGEMTSTEIDKVKKLVKQWEATRDH